MRKVNTRNNRKKKNKLLPIILILIAFLLTPFFAWSYYLTSISEPNSDDSRQVELIIEPGESVSQIAEKLYKKGIISSVKLFKIYMRLSGNSGGLQAGRFNIPKDLSITEVADTLSEGGAFTQKLIFLEGWRREEMAEYIKEELGDVRISNEFLTESKGLEGFLFPDTYIVDLDVTGSEIVDLMRENFEKKFSILTFRGLTRKEAVIFASIVEREVRTDKDRPTVAGILIKRWQSDWPLEADATVQYVIGGRGDWWPRAITEDDLEINSPYNTRKSAGLPPTPISNPGLASLEAVAEYKETPYWYYISDKNGKIHYAETLEEHNGNVFKYLR